MICHPTVPEEPSSPSSDCLNVRFADMKSRGASAAACSPAILLLALTLAAGVSLQAAPNPTVIAGPITSPINGRGYFLLSESSWTDAEAAAVQLGGHLATLRSQAEQDWIYSTFGNRGGVARNLWIGLHDPVPSSNSSDPVTRRSEFVWSSGEPVTYENWFTGEPNNSPPGELYGHIWLPGFGVSGFWNDRSDSPPDNQPTFPWNGVVEARPVISCPPDVTICPSELGNPSVTGRPTLLSSCSPANQVQITFRDFDNFNGTVTRTWTAFDPLCGTSEPCVQTIFVLTQDNPVVTRSTEFGGLLVTFRAEGTRGFIVSANWSLNGEQLSEGNGVHFLDGSKSAVEIDFTVYDRVTPNANFSINVNVQTSCTAQGGGFGGGTAPPPPYTLSRGPLTVASSTQPPVNSLIPVACGVFDSSSRLFLFKVQESGTARINATTASARLTVLVPGGNLTQPTALACGNQRLFFLAEAAKTYVVLVETGENFSLTSQIEDPVRVIALSGDLAFGNVQVGASRTASLTITNTGNSILKVTSLAYPAGFTGDWTGGTIAPGGSQVVTVTFTPTATTSYGGNVTINSDKTSGNNVIPVSGTGTPTATRIIQLSGLLAFGNVPVGMSEQRVLTISNTGNSPLTVTGLIFPSGFSGDWPGGVIAPGSSRLVVVAFLPVSAGVYGGGLTVSSDATSGLATFSVSGTATLNTPPTISGIANLTTAENTVLSEIPFTIGDAETALGFLNLDVESSNPALIPRNAIILGGSRQNRTISITPLANGVGEAILTLRVTDTGVPPRSATTSFQVTVTPAARPALTTVVGSAGSLSIAWRAEAMGFTLESASELGPNAEWNPVPGVANPLSSAGSANAPFSGTEQYFRLRK